MYETDEHDADGLFLNHKSDLNKLVHSRVVVGVSVGFGV